MKRSIHFLVSCAIVAAFCSSCGSDPQSRDAKADFTRLTDELEAVESPGIEKIHTVAGVFLAGQPDESGFTAAKEGGIQTVIDLRHDEETDFDERKVVETLGLTYLHLPWNGPEELTDDMFDRTREMLKSAEKPILLHCKSANRVGAVWLPFRVLDGGVDIDEAVEEAKTVGLKKAEYEEKARDYITRKSS